MKRVLSNKKTIIILVAVFVIGLINLIVWLFNGVDGIKSMYRFISEQFLGFKWFNVIIGLAIKAIFGETFAATHWGQAIQFFIYDTLKIFFLLCLLIFIISYIQSFFPPERTKRILGKYKGVGAYFLGALLGTVTPFCSCSSIPLFMGFTRAGIRSGVTFSFLISSPLVDLGAFVLLVSAFGFPIALTYVVVGLILAVIGGLIIEKTGAGQYVREFIIEGAAVQNEEDVLSKKERLKYAFDQMKSIFKKVWPYVLIGVLIGAVIHNFIPADWIEAVLGKDKWYSVFIATFVGVPMYADIFGTIPVAEALFSKGVGVGTIMAFMMSVTALSLPGMIMLMKAIKPRLLATFISVVVIGIIIIGFVFNSISFLF